MAALGARFHTAKEEVNAELAVFAGDLVEVLEASSDLEPYHQERIEDLLILARECAFMDPQVFRKECEAIVQDLDDKRQELPMGVLKRLHTRMLFILTRCTRLLQFEKENGLDEDELHRLQEEAKVGSSLESWSSLARWKEKGKALLNVVKLKKLSSSAKPEGPSITQLKRIGDGATTSGTSSTSDITEEAVKPVNESALPIKPGSVSPVHSLVADRLASWKNFSDASINEHESHGGLLNVGPESGSIVSNLGSSQRDVDEGRETDRSSKETQRMLSSKRNQRVSWGHWRDQPEISVDSLDVICRICEDEVATSRLEDHSRVCALADRLNPYASPLLHCFC